MIRIYMYKSANYALMMAGWCRPTSLAVNVTVSHPGHEKLALKAVFKTVQTFDYLSSERFVQIAIKFKIMFSTFNIILFTYSNIFFFNACERQPYTNTLLKLL